ncbi:MAG: hypothetical protein JRI68_09530 [Deltaproteobacteria bacterium]|nr:hypothetical protein [Deltaproteobacteria bacterium]
MAKAKRVTQKALREAGETAMTGRADEAIEAFSWMVEQGSAAAAASLAELSAFRGDWSQVVRCARMLVAEPTAVYAGNVFDDMVQLLGLAGHEGEPWASVAEAAAHGTEALAASDTCGHGRHHLGTILQALADYAARAGQPPHELIRVFGAAPEDVDLQAYRDAVDHVLTHRPNLEGKPDQLARHLFALAAAYHQPEDLVLRFFEAPEIMDFEQAIETARVLADRGDRQRAWEIVEPRIPLWCPVDDAQVAPVVLLTDRGLRPLVTPERAAAVLATPRASEAG